MTGNSLHLLLALLAALLLSACGAGAARPDAGGGSLPGLDGLDALRRASDIESFRISLVQPWAQQFSEPFLEQRKFNVQDEGLAWAIFQVDEPQGEIDSLLGYGTGMFYLAVADFDAMRWTYFTPLQDGEATVDLSGRPGLVSPGGFFYCAVLVPQSGQGGLNSVLESLVLVHDETAAGETYYVATEFTGGNDNNPGTLVLPWATLQKAADTLGPGDTVIVRPGDYQGFTQFFSGTPGNPITFSALDGVQVIFDNEETTDGINLENFESQGIHDIVVEGFTVRDCSRAGIRVFGSESNPAHDIILRNNNCTSNARYGIFSGFVDDLLVENNTCSFSGSEHGIYLSNGGDRNVVRGNVCYGNNASGIQFNADLSSLSDGAMSEALIERNVCFGNGAGGGAALNMDGLQDSVIRNNLLYDNEGSGIALFSQDGLASSGNLVICNTIIQSVTGRWCITINGGSTGNVLRNNILWNRHAFHGALDIAPDSLVDFSSDYNLAIGRFTTDDGNTILGLAQWFANTDNDEHSREMLDETVFPFVAVEDFHILPGGLAAEIDTDSLEYPPVDFDGIARPQPVFDGLLDAGCYEAH